MPFYALFGIACLLILLNLILFISGIKHAKINGGHLVLLLLGTFMLPSLTGLIFHRIWDNLDYSVYGILAAATVTQVIGLVFISIRFSKQKASEN